ncbi:MAG: GuaB3 family IMP dehydrogenase-related protein, partial [Actinobacteria bacterium]|nr:GuaB3 family IMP dehydrogenase-related protein [Actinomycetota bacterium]
MEVEIGKGKSGRRSYGFDEIAIVPSRRTRDPEDIDISANIGKHHLKIPILASAMDGVVDVKMASVMHNLGG